MKVQTFLAIGGPLNGFKVTEQNAGDEYLRFNNSHGLSYVTELKTLPSGKSFYSFARDSKGKRIIEFPKCVLIHTSLFD
jgi:hypothetical protein